MEPQPRTNHNGGGRGPVSRDPHGGGGGGRGDGTPDYSELLRRYRLGLGVALASVVMLFVTFAMAYVLRLGFGSVDVGSSYMRDLQKLPLPLPFLLLNTAILLVSSFSVEMARRYAAQRVLLAPITSMPGISEGDVKRVPWLPITAVLGFGFLLGQWMAWNQLWRHGFAISSDPSRSFFYLLTGTHALHVLGGLVALLYATVASVVSQKIKRQYIVVDIITWYWHVIALLWIYIFALLALAG